MSDPAPSDEQLRRALTRKEANGPSKGRPRKGAKGKPQPASKGKPRPGAAPPKRRGPAPPDAKERPKAAKRRKAPRPKPRQAGPLASSEEDVLTPRAVPEVVRLSNDVDEEPEQARTGKAAASEAAPAAKPASPPPAERPPSADAGLPTPSPPGDEDLHDEEMGELRRQLADMRDQMEAMATTKDQIQGVAEKFTGMEDRMGNLLQLSELLSIQYNPFLEDSEDDVFEGRHGANDLVRALKERGRGKPRPGSELVRPDKDEPLPLDEEDEGDEVATVVPEDLPLDEAPDEPAAPAPMQETAPSEAPAAPQAPQQAPPQESFGVSPAWTRPTPPRPAPAIRPIGRSREAYLALLWLEHVAENAPEGASHLLLDHYRRLGWVGEDDYTWLSVLAHSVSVPSELTWADFEMTGPEMARMHRENMTFLDRLFRRGFDDLDPGKWKEEAHSLLEDS